MSILPVEKFLYITTFLILVCYKKLINRCCHVTQTDIINLNVNLLKAPNYVIDYIIIHELCHIKINIIQKNSGSL